jgi:hypothetical protein
MIFIPESSLSTTMVVLSLDSLDVGNSHKIINQTNPLDSKYFPIIHYVENDNFNINGLSVFFVREKDSKLNQKLNCIPLQNLPSILSIINFLSKNGNISDKSPYFLNFSSSIYDFSTSSSINIPYFSSSIVSPFNINGNLSRLLDAGDISAEFSKVYCVISICYFYFYIFFIRFYFAFRCSLKLI